MAPITARDYDIVIEDLAHVIPWIPGWLSRTPRALFFRHLHSRTLDGQLPAVPARFLKWVESKYSALYRDDNFVTESLASVEDLIALGVDRRKVYRIPPGVASDVFRILPKAAQPTVVYFGGMREYKRPDHAIRAFGRASTNWKQARMIVVGDGPMLPGLKILARELGLADKITFTGRISEEELAVVVARSWVNVHCSVAEGWCYSVLEAASCGVPTVCYAVAGVSEAVRQGKSGVLVPDNDLQRLARALSMVLEDPEGWVLPARSWATAHDWDDSTSRMENCLSRMASVTSSD